MAHALPCPECGAEQVVAPGELLVTCTSCRQVAVLTGVDARPQRMVSPALDKGRAAAAARSWLRGLRVRELVTMRATFVEPKLVYLPFVRATADVVGWIFGTKKHEEKNRVWYTDEEIEIAQSQDESLPLSDTGETGVYRLPPMIDVPTTPFDATAAAKLGDVIAAITTEETIDERLRVQWLDSARKGHDLHNITDVEVGVIGMQQTVVYYPFWRVTYRYSGADYYVMVDARTGEVAAGKAPGSFFVSAIVFAVLLPIASIILVIAGAIAIALFYLGLQTTDSETITGAIWGAALAVGGVGLGLGALLTTAGHRSMRYGGEIEGGYGVRPDAGLFDDESASAYRKRRAEERAEIDADRRLEL